MPAAPSASMCFNATGTLLTPLGTSSFFTQERTVASFSSSAITIIALVTGWGIIVISANVVGDRFLDTLRLGVFFRDDDRLLLLDLWDGDAVAAPASNICWIVLTSSAGSA